MDRSKKKENSTREQKTFKMNQKQVFLQKNKTELLMKIVTIKIIDLMHRVESVDLTLSRLLFMDEK